ncbi:MAG: ParA family protein [Candidatus Cloacimonetes bacterium]|nr:ParA family protein [Candidatus Cloacimonadota bacterium]
MGKIISVINQKGGVAKTTIAFNLAKGLVEKGKKVLAIDNDPQGNLTSSFLDDPTKMHSDIITCYQNDQTIQPELISQNLYLIGANIHLSKMSDGKLDDVYNLQENLQAIKNDYDVIIIDCLPSLGFLNLSALIACDAVLIPIKPAPYALAGLQDLIETVSKVKRRFNKNLEILGIIITMVEGKKTVIEKEIEEYLRSNYKELVFNTLINRAISMVESPTRKQSIMEYDPNGKQAQQFYQFLSEVMERL